MAAEAEAEAETEVAANAKALKWLSWEGDSGLG